MPQEKVVWEAIIFGTILLAALGGVIVSFLFLYQRKKYHHRQEVVQLQESFTQEMLHSKAEIQQQTLQHIAAEIHDNFNPTLSVINLSLAGVLPALQEPEKEAIADTKILVKQLMADMRALSRSLNGDEVSRIGFVKALEKYIDQLRKTGFYSISFTELGDKYRVSANKEIILLRMCQEIVNNIVKHAEAKNIFVRILYGTVFFEVEIKDDGKGFDPADIASNPEKQDSTGIRNLRNRALVIDAELNIDSTIGSGTIISILLPLN
jgi:signal transduction histidine kinase